MTRAAWAAPIAAVLAAAAPALAQPAPGGLADRAGRIAVMAFEPPPGAPHLVWTGEGAALLLTAVLEGLGTAVVPYAERRRALDRLRVPAGAAVSHATTIRVGQLLDAAGVVGGAIDAGDGELRLALRVFDLQAGTMRTDLAATGPPAELFSLVERLGRMLTGAGPDRTVPAGTMPPSLPAFEQYVKGLTTESPALQAAHLEQALRLAPEYDAARLALWEVHTAEQRHAAALEAVAPISLFGPAAAEARFRAALSRLHLERDEEAFVGFQALAEDTGSPAAFNALGIIQLRRGRTSPAPATYYFYRAAEGDPEEPDYRFNLGYAYWLAGDARAAAYWLREMVRLDPADADAHVVLAAALRAAGQPAEAARELELARRLAARYEGTTADLPAGLERLVDRLQPGPRRVDAAVAATTRRQQSALAAFHREAGRRAMEREDERAAMTELRRAIYLEPYDALAHLYIARLHMRAGRLDEALEAIQISLWSEESPDAHVAAAEIHLQRREPDQAAAAVERAAALDPDHPDLPALRARLR